MNTPDGRGEGQRLVVVSNRLPVVVEQSADRTRLAPADVGLVTALRPVLQRSAGLWIGWPGQVELQPDDPLLATASREHGFDLQPVAVDPEDFEDYYLGFSNGCLWPLFHDMLGKTVFERDHWEAYQRVNRRFAETIAESLKPGDFLWIHDYHLMLVGRYLRELGVACPLAYFLHIPFPNADLFRRLPWREELAEALLAYDLVGFQTSLDRRNFTRMVKVLHPEQSITMRGRNAVLHLEGRVAVAGHFPIGIDFDEFDSLARSPQVAQAAEELRQAYQSRHLVLGLDRLDYTKGMPQRFLAFERLLEMQPELREQASMIQVVVPSRTGGAEYQALKEQLDQLVGRINGRFSRPGGVPIYYFFHHLDRIELVAHYRASEVCLVTPLRDGMNLVAKEYCASTVDENGVLVLSEFAGAADSLGRAAVMVNPYDIDATTASLGRALAMEPEHRRRAMRRLRSEVRRNNVYLWVERFRNAQRDQQVLSAFGRAGRPASQEAAAP